MAKKVTTFKVGTTYQHKSTGKIYLCKIDYHPWDRSKRLYWTNKNGVEYSKHVSQYKRTDFLVAE